MSCKKNGGKKIRNEGKRKEKDIDKEKEKTWVRLEGVEVLYLKEISSKGKSNALIFFVLSSNK